MNAYFLSLLGGAFLAAVVGMLAPGGAAGLGKHLRLVSVLVLFCLLAAPLPKLIGQWKALSFNAPEAEENSGFDARAQETIDAASRAYFARALTAHLEEKFGIAQGDLRCAVVWEDSETGATPASITLIFSGSAKWKNPHEAEAYVSGLLGCPCDSAID